MLSFIHKIMKAHPRICYIIYLIFFVIIFSELLLRIVVPWDASYYAAKRKPEPNTIVHYPYGEMRFNSDGFYDDAFQEEKTKPRIGYFGDSVCAGVGAGFGYRISDLLEKQFLDYEHLNLTGGLGTALSEDMMERYLYLTKEYDLDIALYMMNLNDILPDSKQGKNRESKLVQLARKFDWLRGRSYLYTYIRFAGKNLRQRKSMSAYELFPEKYRSHFQATAARINKLDHKLNNLDIKFVVVILPYEMQISKEAAEIYQGLGFSWDKEFLKCSSQQVMKELLTVQSLYDAYEAFIDPEYAAEDWTAYGVGECYVYNRGDRIDWNHPNRKGHRIIAEYLARQNIFQPFEEMEEE